ncbi:fatty acid/phospholipid synthesis protein PlsX [Paenibacillus thiaminolyticus]|nr:fatty acid/phospholipid synthesis protein PlsX [Paenibacillus thiaminolyticus]
MRIAIDAMGGDQAPECNVQGVLAAAQAWSDIELLLVGDEARLEPLLSSRPRMSASFMRRARSKRMTSPSRRSDARRMLRWLSPDEWCGKGKRTA